MAATRTRPDRPSRQGVEAPDRPDPVLDISIRTGSGVGSTSLSAFDSALLDAGVGDFNLVTLSSVIPPTARIRHVDAPLAGTHGDLLFCVRAEAFADEPGDQAWAGLGWVNDHTGGGLFVEHHGPSEVSVVRQIELSLADMNRNRGGGYGPVQITLASAECRDDPVCAVVLAAYRVTSWHDGSEPRATDRADAADASAVTSVTPVTPGASPSPASGPGGTHTQVAEEWISEIHADHADHADPADHADARDDDPDDDRTSQGPGTVARVTVESEVDYATAKRYYELYAATFRSLDTEAAGRQLLDEDEFLEEMLDPRVHKYIAWDDDDMAVGMSTLATDVATMPWVSPQYFAHHYPEHTARDAVFYLGFTLVDPRHRGQGVFQLMIEHVIRHVIDRRGVVAWDACQANDDRGMSATAYEVLERLGHVSTEIIDRQTYYAATLHGLRDSTSPASGRL